MCSHCSCTQRRAAGRLPAALAAPAETADEVIAPVEASSTSHQMITCRDEDVDEREDEEDDDDDDSVDDLSSRAPAALHRRRRRASGSSATGEDGKSGSRQQFAIVVGGV